MHNHRKRSGPVVALFDVNVDFYSSAHIERDKGGAW